MKFAVALTLAALAAGPAFAQEAKPAKPDLAKGQITAATCMACHAADGTRGIPIYPILQGQHQAYIVKQLTEFKAGKRMNPIMMGMAAPLTPEDMVNVAAFFAAKPAVKGEATSKETIALGQAIYRGGIASKKVPACSGCHSPNGAGIPAQYPRLGGQHVEYTTAQLNTFRSGERANSVQMTAIAAKLSDAEIKAVADYIAGLH
ncbi:c-type cytochrome [Rubrivivax gelatinosus]|uniref:Cytochrome c553 n=1 Tax=Rubrivivax gelatinosus TaxID=28068 RepID=A0A4R2M8D2_RUBGE|nr:c-type cytochrome [Rubrivivax gelatinosus]MBK1687163.1 cytochrome c4 [Rubrivivax gelatinosus]TCP00677.1 cytochrome c553 [Rubrivivax gelatinosus]